MALRWSQLKNRCLRTVQDTARDNATYTDDDLLDYVNAALVDLASHTAKRDTYEVVMETTSTKLVMPDNFLDPGPVAVQVQGLYWQLLVPMTQAPSDTLPSPMAFSLSLNAYYEWPEGTFNFLWQVPGGTRVRVQYFGYYTPIERDEDVFEFKNRWCQEALYYHILAQAMTKAAIQAANLRQYNIKVDSGTPEDNPMFKMARAFQTKYLEMLRDNPGQNRSVWEASD